MNCNNLFETQFAGLNSSMIFKGVSAEGGSLRITVVGKEKNSKVYRIFFEYYFGILQKITSHRSRIQQSEESKTQVKKQLEILKESIIKKLNTDRGWFRSISSEERALVEAYFAEAETLIDTPAKGKVRRFLEGAVVLGAVAATACGIYGAYSR